MLSRLSGLLDPRSLGGSLALQTARPLEWAFVAGSLLALVGGGALLRRDGRLERLTGLPAWSAAGVLTGLWALLTAFVGFVWDVAWHADTGRDRELFTVPHTLILLGLGGLVLAALLAIKLATGARPASAWRWHRLHVPRAALPLLLLGLGALCGFPLDDYWHANYGIDVTMWSPTHLLMIGGASLSPLALWLLAREAGATLSGSALGLQRALAGAALIGLSTFQLEFDMGVPQWQALYQPALIAAAAGIALVAARAALGRGGALAAVAVFLALRIAVAALLGPGLHHTVPRFPLYLGEALAVEAAFALPGRLPELGRALAAGLLLATAGIAGEWAWTHVWYTAPWQPSLLPHLWIAAGAGVAGSVVGLAAGQVLAGRRPEPPIPLVAAALLGLAVLLGFHLPLRQAGPGRVTLQAAATGPGRLVVNRQGLGNLRQDVSLDVSVDPPDAARGADFFYVTAWQGGPPVEHLRLVETAPGRYHADGLVPTGGDWKSLVLLARGDVFEAVPVAMPADPAYGLAEIPPPEGRTAAFEPASRLLLRESRGGAGWPAYAVGGAFGAWILAWTLGLGLAYRSVGLAGATSRRTGRQRHQLRRPELS